MAFWALKVTLECFSVHNCAVAKPSAHTVRQGALDGAAIEGHQHFLTEVVFLRKSEKVHSLLDLLHQSSCVGAPGQVLLDGDTQKLEGSHLLHTVSADVQGLQVCLLPPVVHHQLLGLGGV